MARLAARKTTSVRRVIRRLSGSASLIACLLLSPGVEGAAEAARRRAEPTASISEQSVRIRRTPAKKKGQAKKKKSSPGKLSGKSSRKSPGSARTRYRAEADSRKGDFDFGIVQLFQLALLLTIAALFWRRRRDNESGSGNLGPAPSTSGPYAAQPLQLDRAPGIDPATVREDNTFVPLGANKLNTSLPVLSLDEDDPRRVAAEIDLLTMDLGAGIGGIGNLKVATGKEKRRPPLALPVDLAAHFSGWAGERLEWHTTFASGGDSGTVAITSRRLLAVHKRKSLRLLPPGIAVEIRRHQHDVAQLSVAESGRGRFSSFLWAALLTVLWFPVGTIIACLALGGYFGFTRRELVIGSDDVRRRYPLPTFEHQNAMTALAKAKERSQTNPEGRAAS